MKTSLKIAERRHELARPVGDTTAEWRERRTIVAELTTVDGVVGRGEAAPLPGRSDDTLEVARRSLTDCASIELVDTMSAVDAVGAVDAAMSIESASARFALESAALDWLAAARGVALHQIIAELVGSDRQSVSRPVPVAALVATPDSSAWSREAKTRAAEGFRTIKFKVGRDWDRELVAIQHVREELDDVAIRLDANRSLSRRAFDDALVTLEALAIEFIEEPVAGDDLKHFTDARVPIAIDETVMDTKAAQAALAYDSVHVAVLKPTLIGGITETGRWVTRAREHRADVVVSHTLEGPIGMRACAELAIALQSPRAAGLGSHGALPSAALDAFPVFAGPQLVPVPADGTTR